MAKSFCFFPKKFGGKIFLFFFNGDLIRTTTPSCCDCSGSGQQAEAGRAGSRAKAGGTATCVASLLQQVRAPCGAASAAQCVASVCMRVLPPLLRLALLSSRGGVGEQCPTAGAVATVCEVGAGSGAGPTRSRLRGRRVILTAAPLLAHTAGSPRGHRRECASLSPRSRETP